MDFAEFKKYIEPIREYIKETDEANKFISAISSESYAFVTIGSNLLDRYIDLFEKLLGVEEGEWISWYVFECELGKRPMSAYIDGKEYEIDSDEALYELINIK
jgi:hypothetical protein